MDAVITGILTGLREKGFLVRRARPWARGPKVTASCAALGLQKLTLNPGGQGEALLFLQVFGPGREGAEACEGAAAQLAAALEGGLSTAVPPLSVQMGECGYDGAGDFFSLRLTLTAAVLRKNGALRLRSPAQLKTGDTTAALVFQWSAVTLQEAEPLYGFGEDTAVAAATGRKRYELELTGILPQGSQQPELLTDFMLELPDSVRYTGCTWQSFTRREGPSGLCLSGRALARNRQEA